MPSHQPKIQGRYVVLPEAGGAFINVPETGSQFVTFPELGGGFINVAESGAGGHDHTPHLKYMVPEAGALPEYFANICEEGGEFDKAQVQQAIQSQLNQDKYNANDWMGCVPSSWLPGGADAPDFDMPGDASWEDINKAAQGWFEGLNKAATGWYKAVNPEDTTPPPDVEAAGLLPMGGGSPIPTWAIVGGIGAGVLLLALAFKK